MTEEQQFYFLAPVRQTKSNCEPGDDLSSLVFSERRDIVHFLFTDAIVPERTAISMRPEKGHDLHHPA